MKVGRLVTAITSARQPEDTKALERRLKGDIGAAIPQ